MISIEEIKEAHQRISPFIRETPLEYSYPLSQLTGGDIYIKLENLQITSSFKLRGALNKILSLTEEERQRGVVTASTGNHGAAVAHVLKTFKIKGIIFLPENTARGKIDFLQQYQQELCFFGNDCMQTEVHARKYAADQAMTWVSPYNDEKIVAGQGTCALEIDQQLQQGRPGAKPHQVLTAVGGGGLIAGVGTYFKVLDPAIKIIGCQPENSAVMLHSINAGKILDMESKPSLADATAGGIEEGAITFPICQQVVDDFILTSEEEIKQAIRMMAGKHFQLIEGGAALPVAALVKEKERFKNQIIILVLSGAKIGINTLRDILTDI